jgi:hypothetical protein
MTPYLGPIEASPDAASAGTEPDAFGEDKQS